MKVIDISQRQVRVTNINGQVTGNNGVHQKSKDPTPSIAHWKQGFALARKMVAFYLTIMPTIIAYFAHDRTGMP